MSSLYKDGGIPTLDNTVNSKLGNLLKKLRDSKGWTFEELEEKSGIDDRTIQRIEKGETRYPRDDTLEQLAKALDVNVEVLLEARRLDKSTKFQIDIPISSPQLISNVEPSKLAKIQEQASTDTEKKTNQNDGVFQTTSESSHWHSRTIFNHIIHSKPGRLYLFIAILVLPLSVTSVFLFFPKPNSTQAPFQGAWVSPSKDATVHNIVHFAAYASPNSLADPRVDYVVFTAWWQGVNPNRWINLCYAYTPGKDNVFRCDTNLSQLHALAGKIVVSFDIYDKYGHVRSSPDGEFTIHYLPSSVSSL